MDMKMREDGKYPEAKGQVKERMKTLREFHEHPAVYCLISIIPAAVRNRQAGRQGSWHSLTKFINCSLSGLSTLKVRKLNAYQAYTFLL